MKTRHEWHVEYVLILCFGQCKLFGDKCQLPNAATGKGENVSVIQIGGLDPIVCRKQITPIRLDLQCWIFFLVKFTSNAGRTYTFI